jgi:hypothetical protein
MMNVQQFLLCFAILHYTVDETFTFLENEYPPRSAEFNKIKNEIINDMYKNNQKVDKNFIDFLIEQDIKICCKTYESIYGELVDLPNYFKLYEPIHD